jgi:hypothetical protein
MMPGTDFHLKSTSPAVDACDTGLPTDLENRVRPYGERYDMGAFEFTLRKVYLPLALK